MLHVHARDEKFPTKEKQEKKFSHSSLEQNYQHKGLKMSKVEITKGENSSRLSLIKEKTSLRLALLTQFKIINHS